MKESKLSPQTRSRDKTRVYKYHGAEVTISITEGEYPKINLYDTRSGEVHTKVHMDPKTLDFSLEKGEIAIRETRSNSGILDFLVTNGIVKEPHRWEKPEYHLIAIVKLQK